MRVSITHAQLMTCTLTSAEPLSLANSCVIMLVLFDCSTVHPFSDLHEAAEVCIRRSFTF